ncbi:MAG: hypothetical protein U9N73_07715 [Candidatus Auribacterota bacterium]|nr:hypothetical protein [Candidatus Auribacterota bacterium]
MTTNDDRGIDRKMEVYGSLMASAARGLVELVDRDPDSPAYGCFYYPYWRSKSSEYVNARCQEAAYSLALLWKNDYPGSDCRGNLELLELARAGILFWARLQHGDGSFDEWYKGEHGFAATAFSSFAISRTFSLIREELNPEERQTLSRALDRAARWLCYHDDLEKINHEAVAAAALFSLAEVLEEKEYFFAAEKKVELVRERQTEEGWFPELGGVDTGYSFLTLEYLAYAYTFKPSDELRGSLNRGLEFLSFFVHPDITTGREYNLCGNSYVSLLSAGIMAEFSPAARGLLREGVSRGDPLNQLAQDDLSRTYHLYNGLLVYDLFRENREKFTAEITPLPFIQEPYRRFFPDSGLLSIKTEKYYAVAAGHSGGLVKIYPLPSSDSAGSVSCRDAGYTIQLSDGSSISSFRLARDNPVEWDGSGCLKVSAPFRSGNYFFPGGLARFILRIFSTIPGGYLLIKKAADYLRRRKNASFQLQAVSGKTGSGRLRREIYFQEDSIRIIDLVSDLPASGDYSLAVNLEKQTDGLVNWSPGEDLIASPGRDPEYGNGFRREKIITPRRDDIEITWNRNRQAE